LMQVRSESILFLLLFSLRQHVRMTRCRATTVAADALLTPYRTRTRSFSLRQHVRTTRCRATTVAADALLTPYRTRTRSFSLRQHVRTTRCRETAVALGALLTPYRTRTRSRPYYSRRSEVRCTRSSSTQRRRYVHFIHERKACHQVAHRVVRSLSAWVRHRWEISR
jgi:hypothetical protein